MGTVPRALPGRRFGKLEGGKAVDLLDNCAKRLSDVMVRLKLQRLALLVLVLFAASLIAAAGETLHSSVNAEQDSHLNGAPCQDPDDDGNPCAPACPCHCCPGHLPQAAFVSAGPVLQLPTPCQLVVSRSKEFQPREVHFRILRPPRA
jgi:hypothetical protein